MNEKTRSFGFLMIILVGLVAVVFIWKNYGASPLPVTSQKVVVSDATILDGAVVAGKSADLGFVLPSKISSITKKVGDSVKAGEILATQENVDLQAQLDGASASVGSANSALELAKHSLKKEKLKQKDLSGNERKIQKEQVLSSEESVEVQKNVLLGAQDSLRNMRAQLAKTILHAPFDGMITRQDGEVGEISGSAVPSFLTVESGLGGGKIEAYATELDLKKITIGAAAKVTIDSFGNGDVFLAKVNLIDPVAKIKNGNSTYKVTLVMDNPDDKIKVGMHAIVSFD